MNKKVDDKIITIDLTKYGGVGTWKGPVTVLSPGTYKDTQPTKGRKKLGRVKPAKGGYLGKKIRKPQKK